MLLILEIGLTVAAWRRGWKVRALLPLGIGFGIGFLGGLIMGVSGASEESIFAVGLVGDLICIGALIGMIAKPRSVAKISDTAGQTLQHVEAVDQSTRIDVTK
jgi:hypothetical protein